MAKTANSRKPSKASTKRGKVSLSQTPSLSSQAVRGPTKPSRSDPMTDRRAVPHVLWYTRIDTKGRNLGYALELTIRREPPSKNNPGVKGRLFWTDARNRVVIFSEGLGCNYNGNVVTFASREKKEVEAFIHGCEQMKDITAVRLGHNDNRGNWSISRDYMYSETAPRGNGVGLNHPEEDDLIFYDHADHMHEVYKVNESAKGRAISVMHRDADFELVDPKIVKAHQDDDEDDDISF
jgi:hypothetical protein